MRTSGRRLAWRRGRCVDPCCAVRRAEGREQLTLRRFVALLFPSGSSFPNFRLLPKAPCPLHELSAAAGSRGACAKGSAAPKAPQHICRLVAPASSVCALAGIALSGSSWLTAAGRQQLGRPQLTQQWRVRQHASVPAAPAHTATARIDWTLVGSACTSSPLGCQLCASGWQQADRCAASYLQPCCANYPLMVALQRQSPFSSQIADV